VQVAQIAEFLAEAAARIACLHPEKGSASVQHRFLRLYASDLERRTRNSSDQACNDAIVQSLAMQVVPSTVQTLDREARWVVIGVAGVLCLSTWCSNKYSLNPELALQFV
jgi:hypothetical protein